MSPSENGLVTLLREEIAATGPLSCARFMQLALYHPIHGYYQRPSQQIGCQGDFYTSVSVGPLFGQLLAFSFSTRLEAIARHNPLQSLQIVEAGAHDGTLGRDILDWLAVHRPRLAGTVQYLIVEPSNLHREAQAQTLAGHQGKVSWVRSWAGIAASSLGGIVFANELLDAVPVLRFGWDSREGRWFEWRVDWAGVRFIWTRARLDEKAEAEFARAPWAQVPDGLLAVLPDGFTVESAPGARQWWGEAALRLARGSLLTLDYGLDWEERFDPGRQNGTLRTYRNHRVGDDPLLDPGEKDITSHVDFSGLISTGEKAGLTTSNYCRQSTYLTQITRDALTNVAQFGDWTDAHTRQFKTLTHPDYLGRAYRVLEQQRGP